MLGEEDVADDDVSRYTTSVRCVSKTAELMMILKEDFLKL